jgi:hypothetical protein
VRQHLHKLIKVFIFFLAISYILKKIYFNTNISTTDYHEVVFEPKNDFKNNIAKNIKKYAKMN